MVRVFTKMYDTKNRNLTKSTCTVDGSITKFRGDLTAVGTQTAKHTQYSDKNLIANCLDLSSTRVLQTLSSKTNGHRGETTADGARRDGGSGRRTG